MLKPRTPRAIENLAGFQHLAAAISPERRSSALLVAGHERDRDRLPPCPGTVFNTARPAALRTSPIPWMTPKRSPMLLAEGARPTFMGFRPHIPAPRRATAPAPPWTSATGRALDLKSSARRSARDARCPGIRLFAAITTPPERALCVRGAMKKRPRRFGEGARVSANPVAAVYCKMVCLQCRRRLDL